MVKAALYARCATHGQNEDPINDQFRACREYAAQHGWEVVTTSADPDRSGIDFQRPGLQALLADAQRGKFNVLLAEDPARLSRDQADTAKIFKQLSLVGVRIVTLAEGEITDLHHALKGLDDLFRFH